MKICAIGDLHGYLPLLPESDLLLISGDIIPLNIQWNDERCLDWLSKNFKEWCDNLPTKQVVLVAGNHDLVFEHYPEKVNNVFERYKDNFHYLCNESAILDIGGKQISIFGTPYCRKFGAWAFMKEEEELSELYAECPTKTDIILSHDAPYGITDICFELQMYGARHLGNKALRNLLAFTDFSYAIHGHLHSSDHNLTKFKKGYVANASLLNERYEPYYPPLIIDYKQ